MRVEGARSNDIMPIKGKKRPARKPTHPAEASICAQKKNAKKKKAAKESQSWFHDKSINHHGVSEKKVMLCIWL